MNKKLENQGIYQADDGSWTFSGTDLRYVHKKDAEEAYKQTTAPEANKEVGASPKSSNPPTADSQAGDELRQLAGLIIYGEEFAIGHDYDRGEDDIENGMKLIAAYAERRATERALEELKQINISPSDDGASAYRYVQDRISALTKEIQQ